MKILDLSSFYYERYFFHRILYRFSVYKKPFVPTIPLYSDMNAENIITDFGTELFASYIKATTSPPTNGASKLSKVPFQKMNNLSKF